MIIAVDGPSGSGKSSTARGVATRLGLRYLDTGATYRAVTWSALDHGLDLDDTEAVARRARELELDISTDPGHQYVIADGTDVTAAIRDPKISEVVSKIATNLEVRRELIRRQRAIIDAAQNDISPPDVAGAGGAHTDGVHSAAQYDGRPSGGIVVEGRDIATVVAPDAELKVLLTADQEARMARRGAELAAGSVTADELRDQIVRRDADDSTVSEFQVASDGAVTIDSTYLTLEEVVDVICRLALESVPQGQER
ncbi:(d)CMP kinase [Kribbella sp. NPDC048915]|uniref:(d)CMP kinase n=1 Tax=Kribbella sp. NPDC048915 TaxID=3155148 RepID=UPI0033CBDF88